VAVVVVALITRVLLAVQVGAVVFMVVAAVAAVRV
jgi:hypothetical protein